MDENERLNTDDFNRVVDEWSRHIATNTTALGARARKQMQVDRQEEAQQKSTSKRLKEFDRSLFGAEQDLRSFSASGDGAIDFLKQFANQGRGFIGLGLFSILASSGNELSKSWQDLTNIGQTFGGSMFSMLQKAGEAGLSLEEFANISKQNNLVIRATNGGFFKMQKELRRSVSAHGSYGFTVEQMNEFLGSNLEVSRRNGSLQSKSSQQVVSDMGDLMNTTTALASASDKTREEILQLASAAMSSSLSIAQISNTPMAIRGIVDKSVREATIGFAALPGEAGDFFSKFFNDTLGASAALTDQGQTLISAGMGGLASEMDAMAAKFRAGQGQGIDEQIYYQDKIIDAYKNNLPMLQAQAAAGNESAKSFIAMASGLSKMTKAELAQKRAANKNTEVMTAFFSSLNSMFGILKGTFFARLVDGFGSVFGKMEEFGDSEIFKQIETVLGDLAFTWGKALGDMLRNAKPEQIKAFILGVMNGLVSLGKAIVLISQVVGGIAAGLGTVAGMITGVFGGSMQTVAKWATILLASAWAFKKVMNLKNLFGGNDMNINARTVNVNGGGGSDGIGRRRGRRGRMRRMRAGASNGFRRGGIGGGLKGLGRGIGSLAGGGLGKLAMGGAAGAALFNGLGYLTGDKELSLTNLAKSGLSIGGGALGGLLGGVATAGLGGQIVGGIGGYAAGDALGNYIFGPDTVAGQKPAPPKAPEAPKTMAAMAGMGAAATTGAATKPLGPDPMQVMIEEMRRQTVIMKDTIETLSGKFEQANRLLSKIEVSAQGIS